METGNNGNNSINVEGGRRGDPITLDRADSFNREI